MSSYEVEPHLHLPWYWDASNVVFTAAVANAEVIAVSYISW